MTNFFNKKLPTHDERVPDFVSVQANGVGVGAPSSGDAYSLLGRIPSEPAEKTQMASPPCMAMAE